MTQQEMFPAGEDLPLFTGAPVKCTVRPFSPEPSAQQAPLFDLRLDPFSTTKETDDDQPGHSTDSRP